MATHSSVLAWRIPGMGEPGGLPSLGLHIVGHDWSDLAAAAAAASQVALAVKNPAANAGDVGDSGLILGSGRSPGRRSVNPLQYSCLENAWTEEPGGLRSTESQEVGRDWSALANARPALNLCCSTRWQGRSRARMSGLCRVSQTLGHHQRPEPTAYLYGFSCLLSRGSTLSFPQCK